jgi:hypothetical protein
MSFIENSAGQKYKIQHKRTKKSFYSLNKAIKNPAIRRVSNNTNFLLDGNRYFV